MITKARKAKKLHLCLLLLDFLKLILRNSLIMYFNRKINLLQPKDIQMLLINALMMTIALKFIQPSIKKRSLKMLNPG